MKGKLIILPFLALAVMSAKAQGLVPKDSVINLGNVMYRQPVKAEFTMVNQGGITAAIDKAEVSCGCATVEYSHGAIQPQQQTVVSAVYDAAQLGHFDKYIAIYERGRTEPTLLWFKGVVVANAGKQTVSYDGSYPYKLGNLSVDCEELMFDDVNRGDTPTKTIQILNETQNTVTPILMHLPDFLTGTVTPATVPPGGKATATLTLDSRKLRTFGLTQTSIYLGESQSDKVSEDKEIPVSVIQLPQFYAQTEAQLAHRPQFFISQTEVDFGNVGKKKKVKAELEIENRGNKLLEIRSMQVFTPGVQISLDKSKLLPKGKAKMKITMITKEVLQSKMRPRVLIITNDPKMPKVIIELKIKN